MGSCIFSAGIFEQFLVSYLMCVIKGNILSLPGSPTYVSTGFGIGGPWLILMLALNDFVITRLNGVYSGFLLVSSVL